jgi:signal transduction histidine kinase
MNSDAVGISLLCDSNGRLIKFLRDDLGLSAHLKPGQPFTLIFDTESMGKAFKFMSEVKSKTTAFDWELCVMQNNACEVLHFAGYATQDNLFIVGAKTRSGVIQFCEELMIINNEQANVVRSLMKEQIKGAQGQSELEKKYYEDLTRLNNELENIQRQLEKKNLELENAYAALQRAQEELVQSEKMASLGRLVSGFAHEINTPIGIAITASSSLYDARQNITRMLAEEEADEEELVSELETVKEAAELTLSNLKRAAELVKSFKRTSIDQSVDSKRLFDINEVIRDLMISLNNKFRQTKIEISVDCPEKLNIYGYPGAISQILTNLIMNSLIYGFEDGTLPGKISIQAWLKDGIVYLDYSDTGQGMEEAVVQKLFEPFFTTRRARGGTGLGMYICYNIVTSQLKGTIACESLPGKGTQFHITFPVEKIGGDHA